MAISSCYLASNVFLIKIHELKVSRDITMQKIHKA